VKTDKPLPANVMAEKAILGAVMLQNELYEATKPLEPEDFSLESHQLIYTHIGAMLERGEAVDLVTLAESVRESGELNSICETPVAYLSDLSADTIRFRPSVRDWVRIVKAKSLLRKLILSCTNAVNKAYDGESGYQIITALKDQITEIEDAARKGIRA